MTSVSYENAATAALSSSAPRILQQMLALDDFEDAARRGIPRPIFGYINGGAETNASLRDNRAVWDELQFIPKALVDTGDRGLKTTLMGTQYDLPFGIPPMGGTGMACADGDVALARAAARNNIPMVVSGAALTSLERVKQEGKTEWFQAYLPGEDDVIKALINRVEKAGYDTLVLTVDVQVLANRENNVRTGFSTPLRPSLRLAWDMGIRPRWCLSMLKHTLTHGMPHFENMGPRVPMISALNRQAGRRDRLSWKHVELMRQLWKGKLVLKGILDPQDAARARDAGVDGVMVSNHGGRQLDGAVSPLRMLPGVKANAGNMAVMMDSGIRRGTDVLKALALGADFVFIGRPFLYAISIGAEHGAQHAINLMRSELMTDMALIGVNSPKEMKPELLLDLRSYGWQAAGIKNSQ
jgi:L-lactate dehydrogenase (cytochrome)